MITEKATKIKSDLKTRIDAESTKESMTKLIDGPRFYRGKDDISYLRWP